MRHSAWLETYLHTLSPELYCMLLSKLTREEILDLIA